MSSVENAAVCRPPLRNLIQIWLLCAVMLPTVAQAQFQFTTNNDGSLNIYQYTGSGGAVFIPDTTNSLPVTSIGNSAFFGKSVTSVTIGTNVTSIGDKAFYNCTSLTNIMIGNSVTSIGNGAFEACQSLTSVTIPNSVTGIGSYAFEDCPLTSITIPDNVTSIEDGTFFFCNSLTNVTLGNSVTNIGYEAFSQASPGFDKKSVGSTV